MMAIDAFDIVARMASLAGGLAGNNAKHLEFRGCEFVMMTMRTLVPFASVIVTTADSDIMLVTRLELLEALDFLALVLQLMIKALAFSVSPDRLKWRVHGRPLDVKQWFVSVFICHCGPGRRS